MTIYDVCGLPSTLRKGERQFTLSDDCRPNVVEVMDAIVIQLVTSTSPLP